MQDGILYHTSRILSDQKVDGKIGLGDACLKLEASTFSDALVSPSCAPWRYESVLRYAEGN